LQKNVRKYAKIFFSQLVESKLDVFLIIKHLEQFSLILRQNKDLQRAIKSPVISFAEKKNLIQSILLKIGHSADDVAGGDEGADSASKKDSSKRIDVATFVLVFILNCGINALQDVLRNIEKLEDKRQGILRVYITSAYGLASSDASHIKTILEGKAKKVLLQENLDDSLIGGFKLQIGSSMIDFSVAGSLGNLKENILANI